MSEYHGKHRWDEVGSLRWSDAAAIAKRMHVWIRYHRKIGLISEGLHAKERNQNV